MADCTRCGEGGGEEEEDEVALFFLPCGGSGLGMRPLKILLPHVARSFVYRTSTVGT